MALLFMDGCDHYGTTAEGNAKWGNTASGAFGAFIAVSTTEGRRGGGCLKRDSSYSGSVYFDRAVAGTDVITVGFAVKATWATGTGGSTELCNLGDGTVWHINLRVFTDGTLRVYLGGYSSYGAQVGSSSAPLTWVNDNWYYIEIQAKIDNTTGTIEVRRDGAAVIGPTASLDTQNGGTAEVTRVRIGGWCTAGSITATSGIKWDDIYILDDAGSTCNDFLGDVRIETLLPSGAGNSAQWTPSTGSNYACVDDADLSTTDYVESSTVGHLDLYAFGDMPYTPDTVHALQVCVTGTRSDGSLRQTKAKTRIASTNYDIGATADLTDVYKTHMCISEENPNTTSAWTATAINGAEFGIEVVA